MKEKNQKKESKYYTIQEVAQFYRMGHTTVWRAIQRGDIPALRFQGSKKWLIPSDVIDREN